VPDPSAIIHGTELSAIARARYPFAYCRSLDKDYNIPTESAFSTFKTELGRVLFDLYGDKWYEFRDCENITFSALELAFRKHFIARHAGVGNAQGVTLGLLCFDTVPTDWNTGHCIATRLMPDRRTLQEFEPQNRQPFPLTPAQCASASLCLFF
jgi:hypothetical protein